MRTKGLLGFQWWLLVARKRHINVVQGKEKKNRSALKAYLIFVVVVGCAQASRRCTWVLALHFAVF